MLKRLRSKKFAGWMRRERTGFGSRAMTWRVTLCAWIAVGLAISGCNRSNVKDDDGDLANEGTSEENNANVATGKGREVFATWYDVPLESLAKRRAAPDEFTAAHNRLPLGTLVRVTHLKNGKTVTVRITDRGISNRKVKLDVCKEAAEELEMVSKGIARVRMEVLTEGHGASPAEARGAAP